jgi:hypothetical protein
MKGLATCETYNPAMYMTSCVFSSTPPVKLGRRKESREAHDAPKEVAQLAGLTARVPVPPYPLWLHILTARCSRSPGSCCQ